MSFVAVTDQDSHPHKITGQIVFYIFQCYKSDREIKY